MCRFWSNLSHLVGRFVDVRGVESVVTGSIGSSIASDRSMLRVGIGADKLLTGLRGKEVGCLLLSFRDVDFQVCIVLSKCGKVVRLASHFRRLIFV